MFEQIERRESRYRKSAGVAVLLSAARGGEVVSREQDHEQNYGRDSNRRNEEGDYGSNQNQNYKWDTRRPQKIWIFEIFPYANTFAIKHGWIPRAIGWGKNKCIMWNLALPFVTDATVPGFEPLPVLTPTPEECATD
ncbi:hypothetical protein Hdeb2414_s0032g00711771 [Helianthus debilis subsp. tardiflorus]